MRRILFAGFTLACLLTVPADTALAKGGSSSGSRGFSSGKSYSSGSHSSSAGSHGFSSGGSSSRGFSSGKSYSSGSHSSSPGPGGFSSGSSPAKTFSSGKSYSSGSSSSRPTAGAGNTGVSPGGGNRPSNNTGFSSPSRPSPPSRPPAAASRPPFASGRSYSSGAGSPTSFPSGKSYSSSPPPGDFGTRPTHSNYDTSAAAMKQREASRAAYTAGQAPRPTYTDRTGQAAPVNPESPVVRQLRRDLDYERWRNRELRERQYYGNSWSGWFNTRPVYTYRDPFSDLFWYWLLSSQSFQTQANWAYNHRSMMDDARYRDLLAHDARIEQEIRNLEQQNVPRDPTRTPQSAQGDQLPPDLMYNDDYVKAVYNPQPRAAPASGGSFLHGFMTFLIIVAVILGLMWLVFFKRWGGEKSLGRW